MVFEDTYRFGKRLSVLQSLSGSQFHGVLQQSLHQSAMFSFYFCSLPLIPLFSVIPNAAFAQMEG